MKYPVIANSSANYHMFKEKEFFVDMRPASGTVILGDGKTGISIKGLGTVKCVIDGHQVTLKDVRYIPDLRESIYSLFLHIKSENHGLDSTYDKGLFVTFPSFKTKAIIGTTDIYLNIHPFLQDTSKSDEILCSSLPPSHLNTHHEVSTKDKLLPELRQYYDTIKTKRQLKLKVPAGFHQLNSIQKLCPTKVPPRKSSRDLLAESATPLSFNKLSSFLSDDTTVITSNTSSNNTIAPSMAVPDSHHEVLPLNTKVTPIMRLVDKPSSSLPSIMTMGEDYIKSCVGFRRIETMKKNFSDLYQPTIKFDNTPADAVLEPGNLATLRKNPRNTVPVPRPLSFAVVIHMDNIFGTEVAVGNIHYGLLFTDRFSRMTYVYPLYNLTLDIPNQLEAFFAHIGVIPKRLISDFDLKLIGGKARNYLNKMLIHVNAAPACRQDKNGLAQRHWQTMVSMARNWLVSAKLPSTFWYYAVQCAAEVCNYFPLVLEDGTATTPFELVHETKPDLRVLFKMFSLAAVRRERVGDERVNKFDSQTVPMIAVGQCPNSNGLLFYNPVNSTFVSSIDYRF